MTALSVLSVAYYFHFVGALIPALESKAVAIGRTVRIPIERSLDVGLTKETLFGVNERLADAVRAYPDIDAMYVTNEEGTIIFHSDRKKIGGKINVGKIRKGKKIDGEAHTAFTKEVTEDLNTHRAVYLPITREETTEGWIGINLKDESIKLETRTFALRALLGMLAAALAAWFVASRIIKYLIIDPLAILETTATQLARGNFTARAFVLTNDEIGTLAETFNFMAEEIRISHKKLEQNIETLKRLLEAKVEFLQIVNHQLRTPVSIMNGYLEFFRRGTYKTLTPEKQDDIQEKIIAAFNQLNEIIEMMMEAFEIEGGHPEMAEETFSLGEELMSVIKEFEDAAKKKNLNFEKIIPGKINILSDKKHLKAIVSNLIDNAIKYTPPGGKITIDLSEKSNRAIIRVIDTGIGLTREDLATIFHKFVRAPEGKKMVPGGSGLGLYITRKIAAELNGSVMAESGGRNLGSTFTLELPIKKIK